jgi:hypothetical protein
MIQPDRRYGRKPPRRLTMVILAAMLSAAGIIVFGNGTASGASAETVCKPHAVRSAIVNGQSYYIVNSVFGNKDPKQCLTETPDTTSYSVSTSDADGSGIGEVQASPFIMAGCWDGLCTHNTLYPLPISRIAADVVTWDTSEHASGLWNAALDEWLSKPGHAPEPFGHANAAELMVWINSTVPHYQVGGHAGTVIVKADGRSWYLTTWRTGTRIIPGGWRYIQFRLVRPSWYVHVDVMGLIRLAVARHLLSSRDVLAGNIAANEIWNGGTGLTTKRFAVNTTLIKPPVIRPVHKLCYRIDRHESCRET